MNVMKFTKYHALGNDYLVLDPRDVSQVPKAVTVRRICHRNFGLGSDGILYGPTVCEGAGFGLRIFNPDGSEAEKSGNGLRIFSRYLWEQGRVGEAPFRVLTAGGEVVAQVREKGRSVEVSMGRVRFQSREIGIAGEAREVIEERLHLKGEEDVYCFSAATIGNPHCVIRLPEVSADLARRIGPKVETHPLFPQRTNVQFLQVLDRHNIRIEIWERGAGYTLASGSSSAAAAAVAHRLGACERDITVHMPGGRLSIAIAGDYAVRMTGPVTRVGGMSLDSEALLGVE